jgi:hypothetical protein
VAFGQMVFDVTDGYLPDAAPLPWLGDRLAFSTFPYTGKYTHILHLDKPKPRSGIAPSLCDGAIPLLGFGARYEYNLFGKLLNR